MASAFQVCISLSFLLLFLSLWNVESSSSSSSPKCRCLAGDACWPDAQTWSEFNASVDGNLIKITPPGAPCHPGPHFHQESCEIAKAKWNLPFWRASQPGAMQGTNWEADAGNNLGCSLGASSCSHGSLPTYAVRALSVSHVQSAVRFAAEKNLRLVIKTTGHDYLGRSTAPGSLAIWLHDLRGLKFHENFIPEGCSKLKHPDIQKVVGCSEEDSSSTNPHREFFEDPEDLVKLGSAVTVSAGSQWEEIYDAVFERNLMIVGGGSPSVSAAGGYLQGGGHSPFSPHFGLAADNVLELEVVNATGHLLVVNRCSNRELFWALRGGGGGTFGVVVSVTHKTHPAFSRLAFTTYTFVSTSENDESSGFTSLVERLVELAPGFSDGGFAGFFSLSSKSLFLALFLPEKNQSAAEELIAPLAKVELPGITAQGMSMEFPSFQQWRLMIQCEGKSSCVDSTAQSPVGFPTAFASRLIPRETFEKSPKALAEVLLKLTREAPMITGVLSAGGKVSIPQDSAVNPAWRKAVWEIILSTSWSDEASPGERDAATAKITAANKLLIDLTPGSGAYMNEADYNEPDWQQSFFGENYARLYEIKQKVDPHGLFVGHHCVGSENWSKDLNCRV